MIKINTNIETQVMVDIDVRGSDTPPSIELRVHVKDYFIGFPSTTSTIILPPLNDVMYLDLEENKIDLSLKAYIGEYHITIWRDMVELTDIETREVVNEIRITSTLIEQDRIVENEPEITVRLKT